MRWRIGSLRWLGLTCLLAALAINLARTGQADPPAPPKSTSTVGMPAKIEQLVIPGPELEVKPLEDRRAPLVLRIAAAYPHGSAFRYDLVFYALEPGRYDLTNSLRRKDGSALGSLDPIPVQVDPVLPPGQVLPNPLALEPSPCARRLPMAPGDRGIALGYRTGGDPAAGETTENRLRNRSSPACDTG